MNLIPRALKPGKVTAPYMPKILDAAEHRDRITEAIRITQEAAVDYFGRINKATETISGEDAAIMIKLLRHMADELERADPQAARLVVAMKAIPLPPIEYRREATKIKN